MSGPQHIQTYVFDFYPGNIKFAIYHDGGNMTVRIEDVPQPPVQMSLRDFIAAFDAMHEHMHRLFDRPGGNPR